MKKPQCTTCDLCVAQQAPHSWNFNYLSCSSHFMLINFLLLQHTPNLFVFIFFRRTGRVRGDEAARHNPNNEITHAPINCLFKNWQCS